MREHALINHNIICYDNNAAVQILNWLWQNSVAIRIVQFTQSILIYSPSLSFKACSKLTAWQYPCLKDILQWQNPRSFLTFVAYQLISCSSPFIFRTQRVNRFIQKVRGLECYSSVYYTLLENTEMDSTWKSENNLFFIIYFWWINHWDSKNCTKCLLHHLNW